MDENNTPKKEEQRPDGGQTGAQFVKKIGVVGCVFFLGISLIVTLFCLFSKPADSAADTQSPPPAYDTGAADAAPAEGE